VSKLERRETRRYLEMFYILKMRELVARVPRASDERHEAAPPLTRESQNMSGSLM
jgi:hypothetical protein